MLDNEEISPFPLMGLCREWYPHKDLIAKWCMGTKKMNIAVSLWRMKNLVIAEQIKIILWRRIDLQQYSKMQLTGFSQMDKEEKM